MTRPTTTGKAQDLITFTRSTTGTALAKISYGEELVTNGDFSSDSDWAGTNWSIIDESLNHAGTSFNVVFPSSSAGFVSGKLYTITLTKTGVGSIYFYYDGSPNFLNFSGVGTFTQTFIAGSNSSFFIGTSGDNYKIDNISVKEVLYDQPDGTLQLFNHPINKPRIEYDAEGNCLGLLVEEARTNALTNSNGVFPSGGGAVLVKNASAPNGAQDAWTMTYSSGVGYTVPSGASFISGTSYTFSFYFKRGTGTQQIWTLLYGSVFNNNGGNVVAIYDIESETATISLSGATANVQAVGNGWYRCSCSAIATASSTASQQIYRQGATDTGKYDYVYGFQVEQGSFPTSYIPTSGSAVTRAADVASLAVSEFGYNQGQGSVVVESDFFGGTTLSTLCYIGEDTSNRILLYYSNKNLVFQVKSSSATQASKSLSGQRNKAAYRYKLNDMNLAGNGDTTVADTSANLLGGTQNNIYIGRYYNGVSTLNGHIKSIQYYPLGLSNAQLQALTS